MSLGGKKREGMRGGVALWKESEPRAQRGETHITAVVTFCPGERCFSVGGAQTWNTLAVFVSGVQGSLAQVTKMVHHLQQRRKMYSFKRVLVRESRRIAAGNLWTSYCRRCGLLRNGKLAEQREVLIRCIGSFSGEGFESRRAKIL